MYIEREIERGREEREREGSRNCREKPRIKIEREKRWAFKKYSAQLLNMKGSSN